MSVRVGKGGGDKLEIEWHEGGDRVDQGWLRRFSWDR